MITDKDIRDYFYEETMAAKANHSALMALPQGERIRKRKCISGIRIDTSYRKVSDDRELLLRLTFEKNLSDFKEGEYLMLHKEGTPGFQCTLVSFSDDNSAIISVYSGNINVLPQSELVLDKAVFDLRPMVYSHFYNRLSSDADYWNNHFINCSQSPTFVNVETCREELDDTIKNFGLSLTSNQKKAIICSMSAKDYYLIQGPPGTGKSFVLSIIILEEILYFKHKVAITGPNHMAINNTLEKVIDVLPEAYGYTFKVGQFYNAPIKRYEINSETKPILNINRVNVDTLNSQTVPFICGLTPHSFYTSRAQGLEFDTLIIDEAGQETIPLALMAIMLADKVILAGDHKQLPPIITSDNISVELKNSIFQRLINSENHTMLDTTFRMREPICDFVSYLFYEGKLIAYNLGCESEIISDNPLISFDSPIVICDVKDDGLQFSEKESAKIEDICFELISAGLNGCEIGVISPFRAQVASIRHHIRKSARISEDAGKSITVDTIDRMQGQEREVIIISMAAGNLNYMREMGDFLYNQNKLNVAISRAKSKVIIVGNVGMLRIIGKTDYPLIDKILSYEHATIV